MPSRLSLIRRALGCRRVSLCSRATRLPVRLGSVAIAIGLVLAFPRLGLNAPLTVMWQNMPIIALLNGNYDGITQVYEAKRHGDFGLGAFAQLDGEMIAVDSAVFRRDDSFRAGPRNRPSARYHFRDLVPLPGSATANAQRFLCNPD